MNTVSTSILFFPSMAALLTILLLLFELCSLHCVSGLKFYLFLHFFLSVAIYYDQIILLFLTQDSQIIFLSDLAKFPRILVDLEYHCKFDMLNCTYVGSFTELKNTNLTV